MTTSMLLSLVLLLPFSMPMVNLSTTQPTRFGSRLIQLCFLGFRLPFPMKFSSYFENLIKARDAWLSIEKLFHDETDRGKAIVRGSQNMDIEGGMVRPYRVCIISR
ncbi:hypothetical protein SLE2022_403960 [Rubroshorea leprosula]